MNLLLWHKQLEGRYLEQVEEIKGLLFNVLTESCKVQEILGEKSINYISSCGLATRKKTEGKKKQENESCKFQFYLILRQIISSNTKNNRIKIMHVNRIEDEIGKYWNLVGYVLMDGSLDGLLDGLMDRWTDGLTNTTTLWVLINIQREWLVVTSPGIPKVLSSSAP